jgi:hypothetical protein
MSDKYVIVIKKRHWYEWLLWAIWLAVEVFVLQCAIASMGELEPRAAAIFWSVFGVLLVGAAVIWVMRRLRH